MLFSILSRLVYGQLRIIKTDGKSYTFPTPKQSSNQQPHNAKARQYSTLRATLIVKRESFWSRVVFGSDLGFSEAYMTGDGKSTLLVHKDIMMYSSMIHTIHF